MSRAGMMVNALTDPIDTQCRPLGYIESVHYILNSYVSILRNVVVAVEFEKPTSTDTIKSYLEKAHNHFISLRLKIRELDNKPIFIDGVEFSSIPIKVKNATTSDKDQVAYEIEQTMNEPIDSSESMWRATILKQSPSILLILTFHHSIFDGRSINKILKYIETIGDSEKRSLTGKVFTAIEDDLKLGTTTMVSPVTNEISHYENKWPIHKIVEIKHQKSKFKIIDADDIDVCNMKTYCKKHELTMNQLLTAVAIKSISMTNPDEDNISIHTPIDLTKYSTQSHHQEELGCFIGMIRTIAWNYKEKSLVEIAKTNGDAFKEELNVFSARSDFNFDRLKSDLIAKFNETNRHYSGGISISNVGELQLDRNKDNLLIKDVLFTTSLLGGLGIFVLSILTLDKRLKITLSYTDPLLDEKFVTEFISSFKTTLHSIK
jgi:NRPS condensation-like uncharacterized protein